MYYAKKYTSRMVVLAAENLKLVMTTMRRI